MSAPGDDAQRDMEQRALRNVRALVDKIEDKDQLDRQAMRKWVIGTVVVLVLMIGGILGGVSLVRNKPEPGRTIILPPPAQVK